MGDLGLAPDLVLVSSARRTLQTLEALEPWADTPLIEPMDAIYLATAPALLQTLRGVADTVRSVMLLGHNPGLHELALSLVGAHGMAHRDATLQRLAEGYPSGALAEFTVNGPWRTIGAGGERLVRFLSPKELPDLPE